MTGLLYQFLIQHQFLNLPGLGTLSIVRRPAVDDFGSKSILPPTYTYHFVNAKETPSKKLYSWLSHHLRCSELEAIKKVNEFGIDLKNKIRTGNRVQWNGVGLFHQDNTGRIQFEAADINLPFMAPVAVEKVIRKNAEHQVRVGEDYRTSGQMTEFFLGPDVIRKRHWWLVPLILLVLLLVLTAWYFSRNGFSVPSTGLQKTIDAKEAPALHKQIQ